MNDEIQKLPLNVETDQLDDIAKATNTNIAIKSNTIVVEGDDADVEQAISMIRELPHRKAISAPDIDDDPYRKIEQGSKWTTKLNEKDLVDEYTVYELLSFNDNVLKWKANATTYYFKHHPYRPTGVRKFVTHIPESKIVKLRKIRK